MNMPPVPPNQPLPGASRQSGAAPLPDIAAQSRASLRARISLVITGVIAALLIVAAVGWMHGTRAAIEEEVNAAARVAEQWLQVLIPETLEGGVDADATERMMSHLRAVGRLRANRLEVRANDGQVLYVSPESTYKAGRFAPEAFASLLTPVIPNRHFDAGMLQISLVPDSSRAVLDAWDQLVAAAGWGVAALGFLWLVIHTALNRVLAPLQQIHAAIARGAEGHFDTRLPVFPVRELDLLANSYNRLADSLDQTKARNARLEEDQAFAQALQHRLEAERRLIARELHDELGQGITAVRAIAGAIQQRTTDLPNLHGSAQAILAMTGQMQDGVRTILQRLRTDDDTVTLADAVGDYCANWSLAHPDIALQCIVAPLHEPLPAPVRLAAMRLLQESLTNVARHAAARHVEVRLARDRSALLLTIADDGRGLAEGVAQGRFGLLGMRERVGELRGELTLEQPESGGLCVRARLPCTEDAHGTGQ